MSSLNIRDLMAQFYGTTDDEYDFLAEAAANGVTAVDLIDLIVNGGGGGGGAPSGPAGGALAGTYPNPTLAANSVGSSQLVQVTDVGVLGRFTSGLGNLTFGDAATFKAAFDLEIGTDLQAFNANLNAIAGLTTAANKIVYWTGSGTAALTDITANARTLLGDTFSQMRTDLGLGTAAVLNTGTSSGNVPTIADADARYAALGAGITSMTVVQKTADYTLAAADAGKIIEFNSGTIRVLTLPTNASVPISSGSIFWLRTIGSANAIVNPSGGLTITYDSSLTIRKNGWSTLQKTGTDTWVFSQHGVASDPIWDAAGDLAVGTGADTAAPLSMGTRGQDLGVNSAGTGLEYRTKRRVGWGVPQDDTKPYETLPSWSNGITNVSAAASGRVVLVPVILDAGYQVASITFASGNVAGASMTNQWFALTDANGLVLAISADDTSTAWGATSFKTLNMGATYTVPTTTVYYLCVMVAGSTVPNYRGLSSATVAPFSSRAHLGITGQTTPPAVGTDLDASSATFNNVIYAAC